MRSRSLVAFLMATTLCLEIAHSLMCFTCEHKRSNWNCLQLTECPSDAQKCLTIGSLAGTGNDTKVLITKRCALRCPSQSDPVSRASSSVYCCSHSRCNIWPPKNRLDLPQISQRSPGQRIKEQEAQRNPICCSAGSKEE